MIPRYESCARGLLHFHDVGPAEACAMSLPSGTPVDTHPWIEAQSQHIVDPSSNRYRECDAKDAEE